MDEPYFSTGMVAGENVFSGWADHKAQRKENHQDKKGITYKAEGGGFQALCQNGFTYQFYYQNEPDLKKYLCMGLSPLNSWVMPLFFGVLQDT